ncbi:MAG: TIGR03862 family flavoprotein [Nitrospira sp.]|nr:TIGR03862 family flavoprotein [Nitrospira sp.]MBH0182537.1 TIGR03862 family flavoprotein [Nitrospira sp.]MBH0184587.1 TIGR03862 family flavoprotein [Nitrospira sp.]
MKIAIIGGGPAGLMAAETAVAGGAQVELYDAMASVGRKFLLAGKGGLNLTHSEPLDTFLTRYGSRRAQLAPTIQSFGPGDVREWAQRLGITTFVGTSGRIFPTDLKAAPLLRAWLRRLRKAGVQFYVRHRWCGWDGQGQLHFSMPQGTRSIQADAVVLALGGGSWPKLGSDAAWIPILEERRVPIKPLQPTNCGFDVKWTDHFRTKFAGHPVKTVGVVVKTVDDVVIRRQGEFVITESGLEGGVIYSVSAGLRDVIAAKGVATLRLDLAPDREVQRLIKDLSQPRGKRTMAAQLERRASVAGVKAGLLREVLSKEEFADPVRLAAAIKSLPVRLVATRPIAEAISTAGGVKFEGLDEQLMFRRLPGVFGAGEMLDWEAPTGGYLLTACLATGHMAGAGALKWLTDRRDRSSPN